MYKRIRVYVNSLFHALIKKRNAYISERNFLLIASAITGILSGLAAILLKKLVHLFQQFCQSGFDVKYENYLYLIYPIAGILLSLLYLRIFHYKKVFDKGLSSIIYSISKLASKIPVHKTYSHLITSALTVGFGGSAGLEAPIAVTGSAIGSNTAKNLWMSTQNRTLLLAGGAAAGIAAIFNTPIAGVIFSFEVLLSELSVPAFIPVLIASASGALISGFFQQEKIFQPIAIDWSYEAVPFYVLLGVVCALLCVYMIRTAIAVEHLFGKTRNPWWKAIGGSLFLGLLLFLFPPLYGEGYDQINALMKGELHGLLERSLFFKYTGNEWFLIAFAGILILVKVLASSVTIGAGGNGGIFAPALFSGAFLGLVFSRAVNHLQWVQLNEQNFVAVAMSGLISGVLHAPLTAIFLIAEITGGYNLFVPLMIVSAISFFVTRYFEPNSIYYKTLVEKGYMQAGKSDEMLNSISVSSLIDSDYPILKKEDTLRMIVEKISMHSRNIFVVINAEEELEGIVLLDDLREVMFQQDLYDKVKVKDLMNTSPISADITETAMTLLDIIERNGLWKIPVTDSGKYLGILSKAKLLNKYKQLLSSKEEAL
jgi:CIC family chloride channel protein